MSKIDIYEVFNGLDVPDDTYVAQEAGRFEKILRQGIKEKGTLCLITGSSKTGKTTLYNRVLESIDRTPIKVRCDSTLNSEEFWKYPLESIDFSRIKSLENSNELKVTGGAKLGGTLGWQWLAKMIGEVNLGFSGGQTDKEIQEKVLSKPSPHHLIPLLKNSNGILVVEDFHYLEEQTQKEIFQQWKVFTDNQVSVIVVGTSHHGVDLAYANTDLIGRIKHVDLGRWSDEDLQAIAKKGMSKLNVTFGSQIYSTLAKECAGLPILMQQACAQLFFDKNIEAWNPSNTIKFSVHEAKIALHNVAITRYSQFESLLERIVIGPRKKARKYDTYSLILALFTQDPPKFSLRRHEIDERLASAHIDREQLPPAASINSTLAALEKFQKTNNIELLEWSRKDKTVFILEPSFLFYIRWRAIPVSTSDDVFKFLLHFASSEARATITATAVAAALKITFQ